MATSETTNLQLVKYGAGTDNFIRTDYNGNLDKIDTFAGNTNQAIGNLASLTTTEKGSLVGATNEIKENLANKANKIYETVSGNSSITVDLTGKLPALVMVGRSSTSATGRLTLIDSWGGIANLVTHTTYSLSMNDNVLTITNGGSYYASLLIIY